MNRYFTFLIVSLLLAINTTKAQASFTTTVDDRNVTILNGSISKTNIAANDAFKGWYAGNQNGYKPDTAITNALAAAKNDLHFVIFGGTWCEDTQSILPKFFRLQELAEINETHISLYGVDRAKNTIGNLTAAFGITNVPTIIVMKNGKEIGRVVEYGKTGKWDAELAALVK